MRELRCGKTHFLSIEMVLTFHGVVSTSCLVLEYFFLFSSLIDVLTKCGLCLVCIGREIGVE